MMLKTLDLNIDYNKLLEEYQKLDVDTLLWHPNKLKQISIQCRKETPDEDQLYESCGSLTFDWKDYDNTGKLPLRKENFSEKDFNITCDYFKNTYFEYVINEISKHYNVYRGRFLLSQHKTCLTYHKDPSPRLHIPIYTNEDCMMIIEDKVVRLPFGNTYVVDTRLKHTALNASKHKRTHLVFCIDKF